MGDDKANGLFEELKRRHVFRVAVVYVVIGWLMVEVADILLETFSTPDWVIAITDPDELRAVMTDHIQTVVSLPQLLLFFEGNPRYIPNRIEPICIAHILP